MRRADRLFQLVQILRARRVVTASELALELEVSERTIYRDVRDLVQGGIPVQGEAGVGYTLPRAFDLPPLMFTRGEMQALVLGAEMVRAFADDSLAAEARSLLGKVEAVVPDALRPLVAEPGLRALGGHRQRELVQHLEPLRRATTARRKVCLTYVRADGERSARVVRPLGLYFWGRVWTLLAWCELRADFRSFRPDRMEAVEVLAEEFVPEEGKDVAAFLQRLAERGHDPEAGP